MQLSEALASFNRKERYWLIRNALGKRSEKLAKRFRLELERKLGIKVPKTAWWVMDYHFDWLAGALHRYCNLQAATDVQNNKPLKLVQGNQEDIDFVISFDNTLILIEAKGGTSWGAEQLRSKAERLRALFEQYSPEAKNFQVHFILMSPECSQNLNEIEKEWPPRFLSDGKFRWMKLEMGEGGSGAGFWKIVRCTDASGTIGKAGQYWKLKSPG
jgi:hypothetical protein